MKVLIIDDDEQVRDTLRAELGANSDWAVEDRGFERIDETLDRIRPDVMVLDIVEGEASDQEQNTGRTWFDRVRKTWFCPVVVHSAFPDRWSFEQHPFVEKIEKGAGSDRQVHDRLKEFASTAQMIRTVHRDFDQRVREALRDSVHALRGQIEVTATGAPQDSTLARAVRRVVAARVDARAAGETTLQPWERYVIPPLGRHLLTADLLRREDADWMDTEAFRLVLTPSCDLVPRGGATRVDRILVACCGRLDRLGTVALKDGRELSNKERVRVRPILTEGMDGSHVPIPEFQGHVPLMAADLKSLELLSIGQVQLEPTDADASAQDGLYRRVASTDSPFRELVGWAYLRVTGRPGTPEIDVERWLEDISRHLKDDGRS